MSNISNLFKSYKDAKVAFSDIYVNERVKNNKKYTYSRFGHPKVFNLEKKLSSINKEQNLMVVNCGMSAIDCAISSLIDREHNKIIVLGEVYPGTESYFRNVVSNNRGIKVFFVETEVDFSSLRKFKNGIFFFESCSNPFLKILDIKKIVQIAHTNNCKTCVDNTILTNINLRPLNFGIDVVVSSLTKFYSGYNNVLGGILSCINDDLYWECIKYRNRLGLVMNPNIAEIMINNLNDFEYRYSRQSENSIKLSKFLRSNKKIDGLWHTSLSQNYLRIIKESITHPPVLTFTLTKDICFDNFMNNFCEHIYYGAALGYVKTNIVSLEDLKFSSKGIKTLRLSIGKENINFMIDTFNNAFKSSWI